jgi:two-component system sensor histidine kinase HydH
MFHDDQPQAGRGSQWAIGGLALLSLMALIVTAWIMADFSRQQEIVEAITGHLPPSDLPEARELAGELRLQWRLSVVLILNVIASAMAVTLLVRAYISSERSLRKVRVLATDILASIDQGILTTDRNASILSINPCGLELLDCADGGIGIALKDLPSEHSTLDEICRDVLERHASVRDRDYLATCKGNTRNLRAGCSLLRDHNQRQLGTVIHIRDVTEKTLMEQRLRRMERYMGLGSLAAGLQHEIKNPLGALSLHVQLLNEALDDGQATPAIREILDVLNTETRRINGVLEGFRDFASVAKLNRTEVDVAELIRKLVRLIEPQAQQQQVRIETELQHADSLRLLLDPGRIEQVLLNLVVNAMAAMPDGGVLKIRLVPSVDTVEIKVADTGGGIPEALRDKIFDPYFTTRSTGTGMGLALSEKIVRQHDGNIDFQSGPDGTVFTISLPRNESS